jgi:hypothetical protein
LHISFEAQVHNQEEKWIKNVRRGNTIDSNFNAFHSLSPSLTEEIKELKIGNKVMRKTLRLTQE